MRFLSLCAAAFLVLLRLPVFPAQESAERDRKLQEKVDALSEKVGEALGVKFKNKVPAAYQSRDDFAKWLREMIEKLYPPEKIQAITRTYQLLGLVPDDFNFTKTVTDVMKVQAGAYYNPETKKMYVLMSKMPDIMLDAILFHELVHAAQDQEHDLDKTSKALEKGDNDDAANGFRFLVEGEASYWMQIHILSAMGQDFDKLTPAVREMVFSMMKNTTSKSLIAQMEQQAKMAGDEMPELKEAAEQIKKVPPILVRMLMDPYVRGMYTAYRIHAADGRAGFRSLFKEPPPWNTRDMMYPEDWMKSPRGVATVRLASADEALGGGWKKIHEDTLGALTLHTLFEDQRPQADAVAKGWDGDRMGLWKRGDEAVLAACLVFDAEEAASTFAKQLERVYREQWTKGAKIEEHAGPVTHLSAGSDHFLVKAGGKQVAFCRGAATLKLLNAIAKSEVKAAEPVKKP